MMNFRENLNNILSTILILWKSSKRLFLFTLFLNFVIGLINPINIYIWKNVLDQLTKIIDQSNNSLLVLLFWLILYLIISLIKMIFTNTSQYNETIYSEHIDVYIKSIILNKIKKLELKDFDDSAIYNEISKANEESKTRSLILLSSLLSFIRNMISCFGVFFILIKFSPIVMVLCIISSIPLFFLNCKVMTKIYKIYNRRYENIRLASILESIYIKNDNLKELKIYNAFSYLENKILDINYKIIKEDKSVRKNIAIKKSLLDFFDLFVEYIIKFIAILISISKKMSIGSITMYISSIDTFKNSIFAGLELISTIIENSLYMRSIINIMNYNVSQNGKLRLNDNINTIEFKKVSFKYPNNESYVLKNISFRLERGNIYSFVGINGAGKTTIIKLILTLYKPNEGHVYINDIDVELYEKESLFNKFSAVFQDYIKYPFDIESNITVCNTIDQHRLNEAIKNSGIDKFVKSFDNGLKTKLGKEWSLATNVSQGQWQSIAIARAFYRNCDVLILDEPSSSLDAEAEYELFKRVESMKKDKICILVSHRLSNIKIADQVFVIETNKITEKGKHDELININKTYAKLYNLQKEMYKS